MTDPTAARRTRLLALYEELDEATGEFLRRCPDAACDPGCADCCRAGPPLVSRQEAEVLLEAVSRLAPPVQAEVRRRARELAVALGRGAEPNFECPLLIGDDHGVPRCATYALRPYACRTFGHTARVGEGEHRAKPFTCERLMPRVSLASPPAVPFRSEALRHIVGVETLCDSYVPIWVGLSESEQEERPSGGASSVVVGRVP